MKLLTLVLSLFIFSSTFGQIVNIPDANFKNALLHSNCVDTNLDGFGEFDADLNNDGEIQVTEAESLVGLILFNENIESLTGIASFINLELILCNTNQLTTLDLSENDKLVHLNCGGNQLTELQVSHMTNLEVLKTHANELTTIDVTQNLALNYLNCSSNNLSSLDISPNMNLYWLVCSINSSLTSIDVSNNTALGYLYCVGNNLTNLDVSQNINLIGLRCEDNQLTYLNIANGNNENLFRMFSFNNPDLNCIMVDDETASVPTCNYEDLFEGWCKDEIANYSNFCGLSVNNLETDNFQIQSNPASSQLKLKSQHRIERITLYSSKGDFVKEVKNSNAINISQLATGVYFVEVKSNNKLLVKKFIKE